MWVCFQNWTPFWSVFCMCFYRLLDCWAVATIGTSGFQEGDGRSSMCQQAGTSAADLMSLGCPWISQGSLAPGPLPYLFVPGNNSYCSWTGSGSGRRGEMGRAPWLCLAPEFQPCPCQSHTLLPASTTTLPDTFLPWFLSMTGASGFGFPPVFPLAFFTVSDSV